MAAATELPALPSPPAAAAGGGGVPEAEVAAMKAEMESERALRESVSPKATAAATAALHATHAFQCGAMAEGQRLLAEAEAGVAALLAESAAGPRAWYTRGAPAVGHCLEAFATAACFWHFFAHGALAARASLASLQDSEYLQGAMGFAQELSRYAIGRATAGDVGSVLLCSTLSASLFAKLQEYDFRNGPLRRKVR